MNAEMMPKQKSATGALIAGFLLAVIHQYLFYANTIGISFLIFVVLFYAYMLYFSKEILRKPTWFSYLGLGVIFLLSLTYMLFQNPFFFSLNIFVVPALIVLHMTYMLNSRNLTWANAALIGTTLEHLIPQNLRHWATAMGMVKKVGGQQIKEGQKQVLSKVLIGLAISFPLLLVVITLLSSADGVFNQMLSEIPKVLNQFSFGEGIIRTLWIVLVGIGLFGYLWGFVNPHQPEEIPHNVGWDALEPSPAFKIDPIIAVTILFAVNAVYVLFVVVQFTYLFGAWEGILPQGSSYADYARSGFFELIMVTSLNFAILMSTLLLGEQGQGLLQRTINILLYVMVGCSMVMLYSAFTRLNLYEEAYGYTYIRFLVHAFMIFLAVLLIIAGLRIVFQQLPLGKYYIILGLVSYVIMNYVNMDVIIASKNIERFEVSGNIDADYLGRLSSDATPLLIKFAQKESGLMDEILRNQWSDTIKEKRSWPSFNVSEYRAQHALEKYFSE